MVFFVAYPETKGEWPQLTYPDTRYLPPITNYFTGKSLEEIDEIFGDVKIVHGNNLKLANDEENVVETLEVRSEKAEG